MYRVFFFLSLAFAFCICTANSQDEQSKSFPAPALYLESISSFGDDRQEAFIDDYVAHLSDGSGWKVHPSDKEKFNLWQVKERVALAVRTSYYFIKREHKFELHNLDRCQNVRVMFVKYPDEPLIISDAECEELGERLSDYEYHMGIGDESDYWTHHMYNSWKLTLKMSNGEIFAYSKAGKDVYVYTDPYNIGTQAYVAIDANQPNPSYFIISGIGREATYEHFNLE